MRIRAYLTALLAAPAGADDTWQPPQSLEWMPAGTHDICAGGPDGEAIECTVNVSESDVPALDLQLQQAIAAANEGKASRPFVDANHEGKEAFAIPVKFFWQDGIRLAVEWTAAGLAALKGRVYSYFSPEFFLGEDGHPVSIPSVGQIGSLVNTPAFQTIEKLAAGMQNPAENADKPKGPTMESLLAKLAAAGVITATDQMNEDQLVECIKALKAGTETAKTQCSAALDEVKALTAKLTEAGAELAKKIEAEADAAVSEAIKAGKIEEATKEKWCGFYKDSPENAKAFLASIKAQSTERKATGHPNSKLPSNKGDDSSGLKGIDRVKAAFAKAN